MIKLSIFNARNNAKLRFFSDSMAAAAISQETLHPPHQHDSTSLNTHYPSLLHSKSCISALLNCKDVLQIKQVHTQIAVNQMHLHLAVANKLLYIYTYHRAVTDANSLFNSMIERDAVSWSVMVGGFAKVGDCENCFRTFRELIRSGAKPDNFTLPFMMRACKVDSDLRMGGAVHCIVWKNGWNSDQVVCAAIVDMYAKCRLIDAARQLFDEMLNRDIITWTVMIGACADCGYPSEALDLFDQMKRKRVVPDKITMVTVVNACTKLGALNKAKSIHDYITTKKLSLNVILATALINMYAKCGSVDLAKEVFDKMPEKNVISWSAMIATYAYHGEATKALELFPMMLSCGISPNEITFVSLLYACSHAGLVEEGMKIFDSMKTVYSVKADAKHYTCMVDLLGRSGRFNEALHMLETVEIEKDQGLLGALLAACRKHKRIDLAEKIAESLLEMKSDNPGYYVLLSNIYANAGRWDDVARVRELMTHRKLKKVPGWAWVEVIDKVHRFGSGDRSHPQSQAIYSLLKDLYERLESAGYVPDTNFVLHDVDEEVKVGMLSAHCEKLAIAFGLLASAKGTTIRVTKNLRVCGDCHSFCKYVSATEGRVIVVRDANRFHHFEGGVCSCGDYW